MKRQLYVTRTENEHAWAIACDGRLHGPYKDRREAVRHAVGMGMDAGRHGDDAEVLVADDGRRFRIEWTYIRDGSRAACLDIGQRLPTPSHTMR